MRFAEIGHKSINLAKRKYPLLVFDLLAAAAATILYNRFFMHRFTEWQAGGSLEEFWTRLFLPQLVFGVVWILIFIYTVVYFAAESDTPVLSSRRLIYTLREFPNFIVTSIFFAVRLIPYLLLTVVIIAVPTAVMALSSGGAAGDMMSRMLIVMLFAYLPMFWGIATLALSPYITVCTDKRYWAATRESVSIYKRNRKLLLGLMVPILVLMYGMLALYFPRSVQEAGNIDGAAQAGNLLYSLISILLYMAYTLIYAAIVREQYPPEQRRAE
jgi:hypothetical protein